MVRIDLYEIIQPHYVEFCESVEPKELIIYLPKLTRFDKEDISTHRMGSDRVASLVRVISAKVRIDDLLRALMKVNLEELAEKLENEYNRKKPAVRACRFGGEPQNPENNDQPRPPSQTLATRPQIPPQGPPHEDPPPPPKKETVQQMSQTDIGGSSSPTSVINNVTNIFHENVSGSVNFQFGNENRSSYDSSNHQLLSGSEGDSSVSSNGSYDESRYSIVECERDDTSNANQNYNEQRAFTSRLQSVQAVDANSTSLKHKLYEREGRNSTSSSSETSLKKSLDDASFTSSSTPPRDCPPGSSSTSPPRGNSSSQSESMEATAALLHPLGVALRENNTNPTERSPSDDNEETREKQRFTTNGLPIVNANLPEASKECGITVNTNVKRNTASLLNSNDASGPLINKVPLVASSVASITLSKASIAPIVTSSTTPMTANRAPLVPSAVTSCAANGDAGIIPRTANVARSDAIVQNSRSDHVSVPQNNGSSNNNNNESLSSSSEGYVVHLKSSAELKAETLQTQRLSSERRITNTAAGAIITRTVSQLSSGCSDSFVVSNLGSNPTGIKNEIVQKTVQAKSSKVEEGGGLRLADGVRPHEAEFVSDKRPNNSSSEVNIERVDDALNDPSIERSAKVVANVRNGPIMSNAGMQKNERNGRRTTLGDLGSNSTSSFEISINIDSDNICCDGTNDIQHEARAEIKDNDIRTRNDLNSSFQNESSEMRVAVNVSDDIVADGGGESFDDELSVDCCSEEATQQNVVTSNSIPPEGSASKGGLLSSAFKILLTVTLATQKCTNSSFQ